MNIICTKDKCTGCGACYATCPTNSIAMKREGNLHEYPVINVNTCVDCGKCLRVCPSINGDDDIKGNNQHYFCGWNLDDAIRSHSTSGGVAFSIAKHAIELGFSVCGVCFDKHWNVVHKVTDNLEDLKEFAGSKYVQSDTSDAYIKVKQLLKEGKKVLYIGTPCQTEGLRRIVNESEKVFLITCEIICHGVNSPRVWNDYVEYIEKEKKGKLCYFNFRSKKRGWQKKNGGVNLCISYALCNGKSITQPFWRNVFAMWFAKHYILRASCLSCQYRKEIRKSDLTIGDFWNIEKVVPNINQKELFKGVSVVITSSFKGEDFLCTCSDLSLLQVSSVEAKRVLKGFVEKKSAIERKKEIDRMRSFEAEYEERGIEEMIKLYPVTSRFQRLIDGIRTKLKIR